MSKKRTSFHLGRSIYLISFNIFIVLFNVTSNGFVTFQPNSLILELFIIALVAVEYPFLSSSDGRSKTTFLFTCFAISVAKSLKVIS